jgi:hypothetical protein
MCKRQWDLLTFAVARATSACEPSVRTCHIYPSLHVVCCQAGFLLHVTFTSSELPVYATQPESDWSPVGYRTGVQAELNCTALHMMY